MIVFDICELNVFVSLVSVEMVVLRVTLVGWRVSNLDFCSSFSSHENQKEVPRDDTLQQASPVKS